ncbi:hypothetical protein [Entomohabitans teleogrylli]|uniref:hypothetical protein n=1 Tax=Entomohabitans teleogrylli TaxID=1384589 RepID=UPI00073D70AA|nr:hypothetical protein [Entomohabitans teleogrylli]
MDARTLFLKSGFNFRDTLALFHAFKRASVQKHERYASHDFFDFVAKRGHDIAGGLILFSGVFLVLIIVMAVTGDIQGIPLMIGIYVVLLFVCIWGLSRLNYCSLPVGIKLSIYFFRYKIMKSDYSSW